MNEPFHLTALRRRHAQKVRDVSSSYKIDLFIVIKTFLNPEGHQSPFSNLKVTVFLPMWWIFQLVELHRERSAPAACTTGLFKHV